MPSNGPAESVLYGFNGIPLFTYGMIGITTLVLAYVTFADIDANENPLEMINPAEELKTVAENIQEPINSIMSSTGIDSNSFNPNSIYPPESTSVEPPTSQPPTEIKPPEQTNPAPPAEIKPPEQANPPEQPNEQTKPPEEAKPPEEKKTGGVDKKKKTTRHRPKHRKTIHKRK